MITNFSNEPEMNLLGGSAGTANTLLPKAALTCPRCESTNTKFCYYNNYSLSEPRHFCKECRRYWTAGGPLRKVPVVGGFRPNRRSNSLVNRDQTNSGPTATISSTIIPTRILQLVDDFPAYAGFHQHVNLNSKGDGGDYQGSTSVSTHHGTDARGSTSYGGLSLQTNLNSTHHGPDAEESTSESEFGQQMAPTPLHVCINVGIPGESLGESKQIQHPAVNRKILDDWPELSDSAKQIVIQAASAAISFSIGGPARVKDIVLGTTLVGIGFTFAGIGMRIAKPKLASVAAKIGAVASATAVIVGLAAALPLMLAWPAGIVAAMGVAVAVAFA